MKKILSLLLVSQLSIAAEIEKFDYAGIVNSKLSNCIGNVMNITDDGAYHVVGICYNNDKYYIKFDGLFDKDQLILVRKGKK